MNGSALFFLSMGWGIILLSVAISMTTILKNSR